VDITVSIVRRVLLAGAPLTCLMVVPVVQVRIVRMAVDQRLVLVRVAVWLLSIPGKIMLVLVVDVMPVAMVVADGLMHMLMLMPFTDMEPYAERHQAAG